MLIRANQKKIGPIISFTNKPLVHFDLIVDSKNHYVNCYNVNYNHDTTRKIDPQYITMFIDDLCNNLSNDQRLLNKKSFNSIDLWDCYFAVENIRDIYSNTLSNLIKDDCQPTNKQVIGFGYVDTQKSQRKKYINVSENSNTFNYIKTKKFDRTDLSSFVTIFDLKKTYKYFIDLMGHSYSTKSLLFLGSKRVFFSSVHRKPLKWEKQYLKPWKNYVPVDQDLSNLEENYKIIESDPSLYENIVKNNLKLLEGQLSSQSMMNNLIDAIFNKSP